MLGEVDDAPLERSQDNLPVVWSSVFQNVLDDVVAVLVLGECVVVVVNFLKQ